MSNGFGLGHNSKWRWWVWIVAPTGWLAAQVGWLVWGLSATWHSGCIHQVNQMNLAITLAWWQHHKPTLTLVLLFLSASSLPHAVNCVRFFFGAVCDLFCLCMKYLGNHWTDLRQIHMKDVFWSLAWACMVKVTRAKIWHFSALLVACVRFMFG